MNEEQDCSHVMTVRSCGAMKEKGFKRRNIISFTRKLGEYSSRES